MLQIGFFTQVSWVVSDLDEAVRRWHRTTGIGPFHILRSPPIENFRHRGLPGSLDMDVALAQAGDIQIELIQQKGDAPSAYRDAWAPGGDVLHHMGRVTPDFDADYARYRELGFEVAQSGNTGPARFVYLDTRPALGFMVELVDKAPMLDEMFGMIADAAVDWDGSDPYREIAIN